MSEISIYSTPGCELDRFRECVQRISGEQLKADSDDSIGRHFLTIENTLYFTTIKDFTNMPRCDVEGIAISRLPIVVDFEPYRTPPDAEARLKICRELALKVAREIHEVLGCDAVVTENMDQILGIYKSPDNWWLGVPGMDAIARGYREFCKARFPSPAESQLVEWERRFDIRLPAEYRSFLLGYNGGHFDRPRIAHRADDGPVASLAVVFGVETHGPSDELPPPREIVLPQDHARFEGKETGRMIPFGLTAEWDLIFLTILRADFVTVGLEDAVTGRSSTIAYSIDEFFQLLRVPEPV